MESRKAANIDTSDVAIDELQPILWFLTMSKVVNQINKANRLSHEPSRLTD